MKLIIKRRISEANIQAEFYCRCKENNLNCYLEYKIDNCRFDCVIYDENKNIYAIVEIKSYTRDKEPNWNTKQMRKYRQFNLPIYLITKIDQIDNIISKLKETKFSHTLSK